MAGFFDDQEREDRKTYKNMMVYFVAAISLVMLLFLVVIYVNTAGKNKKHDTGKTPVTDGAQSLSEDSVSTPNDEYGDLTSQELDFWGMYEEDKDKADDEDDPAPSKKKSSAGDDSVSADTVSSDVPTDGEKDSTDDTEDKEEEKEDPAHIKAKAKGQDEKAYDILEDVKKNPYDFKAGLNMDIDALEYKDGNTRTVRGVDVSKYQGAIDWTKVKAAGIDYAMIRVGARGYGSGQLMLDDNFVANIMGARAAGLDTGVYFFTQATTEAEAIEEANFTVGALMNYGASYPIALDVEWVENDNARTDDLTPEERTALVIKFCETVRAFGYTPVIYGSKDMLIAGLLPEKLEDYDVWLSDDYDPVKGTSYPYNFTMWQYTKKGRVDGIPNEVDLNLCFVNYKEK